MKLSNFIASLLSTTVLISTHSNALSLKESFELAQQGDPQIAAAKAEYNAAIEQIPQARSALLPNITLDFFSGNSDTTTNGSNTDIDNQGYQLTLSQSLYNHQLYKLLDQAKAGVAQAAINYSAQQQALLLRVADRYFKVLAAEDNLSFAIAEKKAVSKQLQQTKKRFEVGLIAITDVKEAQAQHDITAAQEIAAQNQLATSKEALQVIINQNVDQLAALPAEIPLKVPAPNDINQWTQTAQQQNLSIKAATFALEAAQAGRNASRSGHYPNLSLQATQSNSTFDQTTSSTDIEDTTISINLNIPLYSGGSTSSKSRQAGYKLQQAQSDLLLQQRLATQQTRSAFLGLNAAIASVKALKQALISSQSAVEATQAGFEVGTRTSVDVLNALRNQFRSERDYAQTRYDYLLNLLKLKQAAGVLDKKDISMIDRWLSE
ncbi:MAG: TolC family outer membrane protein [Gammaproteobacteria bacterium]|nr:TolC family outer membrane protein [Gammaproteobacteria bacterium]